jgi:hypothetical protein
MRRAAILVLVFALLGSAWAIAENKPEQKDDAKKEEVKKETPLEKLLSELKTLTAKEKAKPQYDTELVKHIDALVKAFSRKTKGEVKLEDLSEEDRKKLEEEIREKVRAEWAERGQDGNGDGDGERGAEWRAGLVDRAKENVEFRESEVAEVDEILNDVLTEGYAALRERDYKLVQDVKDDGEKRLRRVIGASRAKKVMNNVNRMLSNRWGGRGGR